MKNELRDRFGPLPPPAELLLKTAELKLIAAERNVSIIETKGDKLMLTRNHDYIMIRRKIPPSQTHHPRRPPQRNQETAPLAVSAAAPKADGIIPPSLSRHAYPVPTALGKNSFAKLNIFANLTKSLAHNHIVVHFNGEKCLEKRKGQTRTEVRRETGRAMTRIAARNGGSESAGNSHKPATKMANPNTSRPDSPAPAPAGRVRHAPGGHRPAHRWS